MSSAFAKILPSFLALLATSPAFAQEESSEEEIVVTGTSIRGVAPAGSQVIGLSEEAIEATGATSTAILLAQIPQLTEFGETPTISGTSNFQSTVNRPTLRNLPTGIASTSSTLLLMDGHRLPGSGILQTFPDPDIVPPTVLQRVEVVPDGGSSIYGADAVGGVINFITRNEFDGVQIDARHGFGRDFETDDIGLAAGTAWNEGSAFIAYSYTHRDAIAGSDRNYVRDINWVTGEPKETRCALPNVTISGVTTSYASGGPVQFCDAAREGAIYGAETRNSVLAGLSQELVDDLDFRLKFWYTDRRTEGDGGPLRATVTVPRGSPVSIDPTANQIVSFAFTPVSAHTAQTGHLETWGFSPEFFWDIGADWQMRTMLNYGHSRTVTHNSSLTLSDVADAVTAGTLDPYNLTDPTRLDTVLEIMNASESFGIGEDEIANARTVFDGPLFDLPGGEVRLAVGGEYLWEDFRAFTSSSFRVGSDYITNATHRRSSAFFGEVNIPLVGGENALPAIHSLSLSLAARHDFYSDFGGVTTTRYGFTYAPLDWIEVQGHWGEAFQAPGLADLAKSGNLYSAGTTIPNGILINPIHTTVAANPDNYTIIGIQGTNPGLRPQTAESWSAGFDITPPILDDNLTFGATYWSVDYTARIGSALSFLTSPTVFNDFPSKILLYPDGNVSDYLNANGTIQNALRGLNLDPAGDAALIDVLNTLDATGKPLYGIYDFRSTNTGGDRRQGIDVRVRYDGEAPFGTWYASLGGAYLLNAKSSFDAGAPFSVNQSNIDPNIRFSSTATLGATIGDHWLGQVTWRHVEGTRIARPLGEATPETGDDQAFVDNFDVVDLYAQYNVLGDGLGEDLTFSLGVNNAFDEDPPIYRATYGGIQPGFARSTFGRVVQIGVSKRF